MVVQHILRYFIKNVPIYAKIWISSSLHNTTLEMESEGSTYGGLKKEPTRSSDSIEGKLVYNTK
jgi:hypothetical protein